MKKFLCLLFLLLAFSGCTAKKKAEPEPLPDPEFPVVMQGERIEDAPKAVLSLSPGLTELLFDMGYGGRVIGVSDYCDYPEEAKSKLRCGSPLEIRKNLLEKLPVDLVVSSVELTDEDLIYFQQRDIPVLIFPRASNLEEVLDNYYDLAVAMGGQTTGSRRGEAYISRLRSVLDEAAKLGREYNASHQTRLRAVYLRVMSYGMATRETFEHTVLEAIGLKNDAEAYTGWLYPRADVAILEPDVIFCNLGLDPDKIASSAVYRPVAAAIHHRILPVDFNLFERQSPRMFPVILQMAQYAYEYQGY